MTSYAIRLKGGAGSGFHGHKGRPGFVGGSSSEGVSSVSSNPSPKTKSELVTKLASNSSYWDMSNEEFANEVNDALIERFPELEDRYDELSDLVQTAINQRDENMPEDVDTSDMADLADRMLGDDARKYPGLDPYSIDLIKTAKRAEDLGIKSFTDPRIVKDIARGAAELINSRTKVGYTVYGSDSPHLSADGQTSLGSFPMVAYGAENKRQVNSMMEYLKGFGYKATIGPENYGILVSPMNTNVLEEYWAGQKEYKIRLKGGVGSGNHGHKGRPGEVGGSAPKGSSATGRKTTKLNRREVHSPNDKPGDLPGIRTRIPNEDGELSRTSPQSDPTIHDIAPYIGDYVHEVEQNIGKSVTWREVYDILNDFGTIPEGMSDDEWDKLAKRLAHKYAGD
jgi:hypothetical protein